MRTHHHSCFILLWLLTSVYVDLSFFLQHIQQSERKKGVVQNNNREREREKSSKEMESL
jgi:hypothetical protein